MEFKHTFRQGNNTPFQHIQNGALGNNFHAHTVTTSTNTIARNSGGNQWGLIKGNIDEQADLLNAIEAKAAELIKKAIADGIVDFSEDAVCDRLQQIIDDIKPFTYITRDEINELCDHIFFTDSWYADKQKEENNDIEDVEIGDLEIEEVEV